MNYDKENDSTHLTCITYSILFANDVACGAIVQCVADVRKSPLCKFAMKKMINEIDSMRATYERRLKHVVGDKGEYYMEACDIFTNGLEKDIQVFYYTLVNEYLKLGYKNAQLVARVQWARALVQAAAELWKDRTQEAAEYKLVPLYSSTPYAASLSDVRSHLAYLDISNIREKMGRFIDAFCNESSYIQSDIAQQAYDIICKKLYSLHTVLKAAMHKED